MSAEHLKFLLCSGKSAVGIQEDNGKQEGHTLQLHTPHTSVMCSCVGKRWSLLMVINVVFYKNAAA